jgi:flavin reductase (DIM6/NTAB) family NADH-FMN oxidoreductase RutF
MPDAFDTLAFRHTLAQFATGVAIVSAHNPDGEPVGITVNSFNAVSLSPPLVLFSVQRQAFSLPVLLSAQGYAVNILSENQRRMSQRFGGFKRDADPWADAPHALGRSRAPLIHGALARFECEPWAVHDGGDHLIFVGRVVNFEAASDDQPLVFFRGAYRKLAQSA